MYYRFRDSDRCPISNSSPVGIKRTGTFRTKIIPKKGTLSHNVRKAACRNCEIFIWDQNNKVKRKLENLLDMVSRAHKEGAPSSEPVFVNVHGAQQSIPTSRFRQAGIRFLGSLKGFKGYKYGLSTSKDAGILKNCSVTNSGSPKVKLRFCPCSFEHIVQILS